MPLAVASSGSLLRLPRVPVSVRASAQGGPHPADLPPGSAQGLIFRGIHESVVVTGGAEIHFPASIIIEPFCSFVMGPHASLELGENITIYSGCTFRNKYGHYKIGSEVSFGPNCAFYELRAGLTIGDYTMIGAGVCVSGVNHGMDPADGPYRFQQPDNRPVRIGRNVWIGMNSTILPGVTIGDDSIIGAGSVVTRDVPAGVVAYGHPCRVIRPVGRTS
jgi:acetyltransferase-like isoleucine patch superfamily enzyme